MRMRMSSITRCAQPHSAKLTIASSYVSHRRRHTALASRCRHRCWHDVVHPTPRAFASLTPCRYALERVEVAHMKRFQSLRAATPSHSSSSSNTAKLGGGRMTLRRPSLATTGTHWSNSPRMDGGHVSDGFMSYGEDAAARGGGAAAVRGSAFQQMRTLPLAAATAFFFRDGIGGDGGSRGASHLSDSMELETPRFASFSDDDRGGDGLPSTDAPFPASSGASLGYCQLCREHIEPPFNQRVHITGSSRTSHTNHTCREVSLDSMALLAMRGFPIDSLVPVWADILYQHSVYPRIPGLVSPTWTLERRAEKLCALLKALQEARVLNLISAVAVPEGGDSSYHHRRRVAFERIEHVGDNAWGTHISSRLMLLFPDQQWTYSDRAYNFNCVRDACEMNINLEFMFDALHLKMLLEPYAASRIGNGKIKADILEALIGELHSYVWGIAPQLDDDLPFVEINSTREDHLLAIGEHCLTEIYDLIVLSMARELSVNSLPLAKELAARHLWSGCRPLIRNTRTYRRDVSLQSGQSTYQLPPVPQLFDTAVPFPTRIRHPIQAQPPHDIPRCTIISHTGRDVFERFQESFERLGMLNTDEFSSGKRRVRPLYETLVRELVPSLQPAFLSGTNDADGAHPTSESSHAIWLAAMLPVEHSTYYRDLLYELARTPQPPPTGAGDGSKASAAPPRGGFQLLPSTAAAVDVSFVKDYAYPALQSESALDAESEEGAAGRSFGKREPACHFAASRYVPDGTRPPSAGVVTDRNLHGGTFAFLAWNTAPDAAAAWRSSTAAREEVLDADSPGAPKGPSGQPLPGASTAAAGDPTNEQPVGGSEVVETAEKERLLADAVAHWVAVAHEKRQNENSYFVTRRQASSYPRTVCSRACDSEGSL